MEGKVMNIGKIIMTKRKSLGYTQQSLAKILNVSFQAVSKWENGTSCPDIDLLPLLASALHTSVDSLLGHVAVMNEDYENRYKRSGFYWGLQPNDLCYEIMKLRPPIKPYNVLDVGCGEGKDAVFLAKNGYSVTALDVTESGIEKAKQLAKENDVFVDFFKADIVDYQPKKSFDIILSSGVFHFIKPDNRECLMERLKSHTNINGIHAMNVFVEKPFIETPMNKKNGVTRFRWKSGELFMHYHDWKMHRMDEVVFDCNSGGTPHQHCMDVMIAENVEH